ncbi:hypothetical protein CBER1_11867 [Cercospora berteroae]|uniref:Uncharacterized protein n=1 Tax=Cercospora berteroae TaxID=357750 RepID=A0A2S6CE22_9PEZI|nr:hypothetical protein CBER1_11867 [Cercospora berteroae]
MPPRAAAMTHLTPETSYNIGFHATWLEMPSIVAVALIVPNVRLHVFTSADRRRMGTPGLHLAVYNDKMFENSFHAIHACFGKLIIAEDSRIAMIDEDALGWGGHSELIVTSLVPTFQFLVGCKGETRAALVINSSGANTYFIPILGPHLRVFDTSIDNQQNFHILETLPGVRQQQKNSVLRAPYVCRTDEPVICTITKEGRLELLTLREQFTNNSERGHLQNGSEVLTFQESPCTVTLKLGSKYRRLQFPFPIDGSHSRTRIARKQLWIEVIVPISLASDPNGYELRPFPVISDKSQYISWSLGRINLDKSPMMSHMPLKTLSGFMAMTLSAREQEAQPRPANGMELSRSLFEMKESLTALFTNFACEDNSSGRKWQAFRLVVQNDSDTLIFANALKHDKDSGSICLDAHVVPLTAHRIQTLSRVLAKTMESHQVLGIRVSEREEILWKQITPALVERCRHRWQHKPSCE